MQVINNIKSGNQSLIITIGDSITEQNRHTSGMLNYSGILWGPQTTFSVLNARVEGDSASGGICRLQRDVIRHDPDLVLVGFCLNDAMQGIKGIEEYSTSMNVPVADVYAQWERLAANDVDTTALLSNGLNHPDVSGQSLIAETIWQSITKHSPPSTR
jgi:lysophospholipase L1-like esterase